MAYKILITGSAGFIGFHLSNYLIKEDKYLIVGLDNINDYYDVNLKYARLDQVGIAKNQVKYNKFIKSKMNNNYRFIKLDLTDRDKIIELFEVEKFDYVVNLAAQAGVRYSLTNPDSYVESNISGFMNIMEACRHNNIKHLVYASSSSVYGLSTKMPMSTSDNVDKPISLYAATKKSNELIAHSYSHLFKIPSTGLRFFTAYGPWGRPDMALFQFTDAILRDKEINVFNYGDMIRDFTYIDDIVQGIALAIKCIPNGIIPYKIYNLGNSNPIKLDRYIEVLECKLGKKAKKKYLPLQPGDVKATYSDISETVKDLGYKPQIGIEAGISNFVEWYKNFYRI